MALEDLYQEIILDHARHPRNSAVLDHIPDSLAHENPTCGDTVKLEVTLDQAGAAIQRVRVQCRGCAISTASASIMSQIQCGKSVAEARRLAQDFISGLRDGRPGGPLDDIEELAAFKGVMRFPVRVKCATLAWHALLSALPHAVTGE